MGQRFRPFEQENDKEQQPSSFYQNPMLFLET
jgi:hypothetical protein